MARAVLDQVNLVVRDMEATLAFYRLLGVEIPEAAIWRTPSGVHHVGLTGDEPTELAFDSQPLARRYNAGYAAERGRVIIGFRLESREAVDAAWTLLIGHEHQGLQPPFDAFWGSRYAIVEDPDGNPVGLMSDPDPALRTPPPDI